MQPTPTGRRTAFVSLPDQNPIATKKRIQNPQYGLALTGSFRHIWALTKPATSVSSAHVSDPEMLASAIRGADLRVCQLSPRPEPSWLARLALPRVVLDFASFGPAMAFSGAMPRDC